MIEEVSRPLGGDGKTLANQKAFVRLMFTNVEMGKDLGETIYRPKERPKFLPVRKGSGATKQRIGTRVEGTPAPGREAEYSRMKELLFENQRPYNAQLKGYAGTRNY